MNSELVLKRIRRFEYTSGFLAILAPIITMLLATQHKLAVLISILVIGLVLQFYIYHLYKRINQADVYKAKKFWPLVTALFFIAFLILQNHFEWSLY